MAIESQLRVAVRDALHHKSRKPFHWGGLAGYEQMQAIAQALADVTETETETAYLHAIARQVNRVIEKNRTLVHDLKHIMTNCNASPTVYTIHLRHRRLSMVLRTRYAIVRLG